MSDRLPQSFFSVHFRDDMDDAVLDTDEATVHTIMEQIIDEWPGRGGIERVWILGRDHRVETDDPRYIVEVTHSDESRGSVSHHACELLMALKRTWHVQADLVATDGDHRHLSREKDEDGPTTWFRDAVNDITSNELHVPSMHEQADADTDTEQVEQ